MPIINDPNTGLPVDTTTGQLAKVKHSFITPHSGSAVQERVQDDNFQDYGFNYQVGEENINRRAENQAASEKWINGATKGAITLGTSVIDNTIGVLEGIGQGFANITEGEGVEGALQGLYNNPVGRAMDAINKTAQEALPNYYSEAEKNKNILETLGTANFWADKFMNGAGYFAGAYITGLGLGKAASLLKLGELSKVAAGEKALTGTAASVGEDLSLAARNTKIPSALTNLTIGATMAHGESAMEARGVYNNTLSRLEELRNQGDERYKNLDDSKLSDIAEAASNVAYGMNMLIVGTTNVLQFGKTVLPGWNSERNAVSKLLKDKGLGAGLEIASETGLQKAGRIGKNFATGFAEEGGQELAQLGIEKGTTDYYTRQYNPSESYQFDNAIKESLNSMMQNLGTKEGMESIILGGLLGGPGQVAQGQSDNKRDITKANALISGLDWKNLFSGIQNTKENYLQMMVSNKQAQVAMNSGNKEAYHDYRQDAMKSLVKLVEENEGTEILLNRINMLKDVKAEDLKTELGYDPTEILTEETKAKKINAFENNVKDLVKAHKETKAKFPTVPKPVFDAIYDAVTGIDNIDMRETKLHSEINSILNKSGLFSENTEAGRTNSERKEYTSNMKVLADKLKNQNPSDAQDLLEKINALDYLADRRTQYVKNFNDANKNPEKFIVAEANAKFYASRAIQDFNTHQQARSKAASDLYTENTTNDETGFQSSDFEIETTDLPNESHIFEDTDNNKISARLKQQPDGSYTRVSSNGNQFVDIINPDGSIEQKFAKNITSIDQIPVKNKKTVSFKEGDANLLHDEVGNSYDTAQLVQEGKLIRKISAQEKVAKIVQKLYKESLEQMIQVNTELSASIDTERKALETEIKLLENKLNSYTETPSGSFVQKGRQGFINKYTAQDELDTLNNLLTEKQNALNVLYRRKTELNTAITNTENEIKNIKSNKTTSGIIEKLQKKIHNIEKLQEIINPELSDIYFELIDSMDILKKRQEQLTKLVSHYEKSIAGLGELIRSGLFNTEGTDFEFSNLDQYKNRLKDAKQELANLNVLFKQGAHKITYAEIVERSNLDFFLGELNDQLNSFKTIISNLKSEVKVIPVKSETIETEEITDEVIEQNNNKEIIDSAKPDALVVGFAKTAGQHFNEIDVINNDPSQQRWFRTLPKINFNSKDKYALRIINATTKQGKYASLTGSFSEPENLYVVLYKNGVPIDNAENSIADSELFDKGLFTSLPDASLTTEPFGERFSGIKEIGNEEEQKEFMDNLLEEYRIRRAEIIRELNNDNNVFVAVNNRSRGLIQFIKNDNGKSNFKRGTESIGFQSIYGSIIAEGMPEYKASKIRIATDKFMAVGNQSFPVIPGLPYLETSTGLLLPLIQRKINNAESKNIIELLITNLEGDKTAYGHLTNIITFGKQGTKENKNKSNPQTEIYIKDKKLIFYDFETNSPTSISYTEEALSDLGNRLKLEKFLNNKYLRVSNTAYSKAGSFDAVTKVVLNSKGEREIQTKSYPSYKDYLLNNKERDLKEIPLLLNIDTVTNDGNDFIKSTYLTYDPTIKNSPVAKTIAIKEEIQHTKEKITTSESEFIEDLLKTNFPGFTYGVVTQQLLGDLSISDWTITKLEEGLKNWDGEAKPILEEAIADFKGQETEPALPTDTDIFNILENLPETKPSILSGLGKFIIPQTEEEGPFKLPIKNTIQKINLEEAKEWIKNRFPNLISVNTIEGLIHNKAWGMASTAAITLSDLAEAGTEYHEALHIALRHFLENDEHKKLFEEAKLRHKEPTEVDIKSLAKTYPALTKTELVETYYEELIADEFQDYVITGKIPEIVQEKSKNIFSRLWNTIKNFLNLNKNITQEIFEKIEKGGYSESAIKYNRKKGNIFKTIPGVNAEISQSLMEGMTAYFFSELFKRNFDLNKLDSLTELNLKDIYNTVGQYMARDLKKKGLNLTYEDLNKLVKHHEGFLKQFGLNLELSLDKPESENWIGFTDGGTVKISAQEGSHTSIKVLLGSLIKVGINNEITGLPQLVDLGEMFNYLSTTLAGKTDYKEMLDLLRKSHRSEMNQLLRRLENASVKDDQHQYTLQKQFQQAFAKTFIEYITTKVEDDGRIYPISSSTTGARSQIRDKWYNNLLKNVGTTKSYLDRRRNNLVFNSTKLKADFVKYDNARTKGGKVTGLIESSLSKLGIEFTDIDSINIQTLKESYEQIIKDLLVYENIERVFGSELNTRLNNLIDQEVTTNGEVKALQHVAADGETRYNITQNSGFTIITNAINTEKNLKDLFNQFPHLNNAFTQNSFWLKPGGLLFDLDGDRNSVKFVPTIIEGMSTDEAGEGELASDLKDPDRIAQQFMSQLGNLTINNPKANIVMTNTGDKSLQYGITTNTAFTPSQVDAGEYSKVLLGQVADEVNFIRAAYANLRNADIQFLYKNLANNLFMYKDIITIKELEYLIGTDSSMDIINDFFTNNIEISNQLETYINSQVVDNIKLLKEFRIIEENTNGKINVIGLPNDITLVDTGVISNEKLQELVKTFTINNLINHTEQNKIFFGHPAFYKEIDEMLKRTSGLVGTKKIPAVSEIDNNWLNKNIKRQDGKVSDGKLKSVAGEDPKVTVNNYDEMLSEFTKNMGVQKATEILSPYKNYKEPDGLAYMTLDEIREFMLRCGEWTGLEELYQKEIKGENTELFSNIVLNMKKLQFYGPQIMNRAMSGEDRLFVNTFFKMAVFPLIPSVIKGTKLEGLNTKMMNSKVGIYVNTSGIKHGAIASNGKFETIYNEDGTFNNTEFNPSNIIDMDYRFLGIQVDVADKVKGIGVTGTQQRKILMSNMFEKAIAKPMRFITETFGYNNLTTKNSESTKTIVDEYENTVNKITELLRDKLVEDLGAEKTTTGYVFNDITKLKNLLSEQAIKRNLPDNIQESIQTLEPEDGKIELKYSLDSLPGRTKFEQILMALINNNIISQDIKGGGKIQAPITGMEPLNKVRSFGKSDIKILDDADKDLLWYRKGLYGETLPGQVKLPLPKELQELVKSHGGLTAFNTKLKQLFTEERNQDGSINKEKTARYNQELEASIGLNADMFQITGYRIPTSDFNMLEAFEIVEFLPSAAGETIIVPSAIVAKSGGDFDIDKLNVFLPAYKGKGNKIKRLEDGSVPGLQNKIIQIGFKIITSPENYINLLTPNTNKTLLDLSKEVRAIKGIKEERRNIRVTEFRYLIEKARAFLVGKKNIGVAAVSQTGHTLSLKADLAITDSSAKLNFEGLEDNFSMAQQQDFKGRHFINKILDQFVNAFVDVAKDPFIFYLNANSRNVGAYTYLLRRGVPIETLAYFFTNPIIDKYTSAHDANESMVIDKAGKTQSNNSIDKALLKELSEITKTTNKRVLLTEEKLKSALDPEWQRKNFKENALIQQTILNDFIRYLEESKNVTNLTLALGVDTNTPKNLNEVDLQNDARKEVLAGGFFTIDSLNKLFNDSPLTEFTKTQMELLPTLYNSLFISEKFSQVKEIIQDIKTYAKQFTSNKEDLTKLLDTAKNDMILYLFNTLPIKGTIDVTYNGQRLHKVNSPMSSLIYDLFIDRDTNIGRVLESIPKQYSNNKFIKELQSVFKEGDKNISHAITLYNRKLTTYESNLLTDDFRQLLEINSKESKTKQLTQLIMFAGIMQSGLSNTPYSFLDKIPYEHYGKLMNHLLNNLSENTDVSSFFDQFVRNNFNQNSLVPKVKQGTNEEGKIFYNSDTKPIYIKKWIKKILTAEERKASRGLQGEFKLYKNVIDEKGKPTSTYEPVSKLGNRLLLKEYYPTLRQSSIIENNVENDKYELSDLNILPTFEEPNEKDKTDNWEDEDNVCPTPF